MDVQNTYRGSDAYGFHPKTYVEVEALPTWHDEQAQLNGLVLHTLRAMEC
ncbi:hypothetical protein [Piscirickettsia salmonis]|nr:hypothetical protein [Piscirickettsia salmonis]